MPSSSVANLTVRKAGLTSVFVTFVAGFLIFAVVLYGGQDLSWIFTSHFDQHLQAHVVEPLNPSLVSKSVTTEIAYTIELVKKKKNDGLHGRKKQKKKKMLPFAVGKTKEGCNIFDGRWVMDKVNKPMYEESECPYIQPQLTCQEHGRPDRDYQFWRWQPYACDLPKFNATLMLQSLRGKRMLFAGDSLIRGQFVSMICLLHRVLLPGDGKLMKMRSHKSLTIFTIKEYNATIEFYWAPFLLESNSDNPNNHRVPHKIIRKGSINTHGKFWKGADIVVFSTYIWWMTGRKMRILKGTFNDKVQEIEEITNEDAYRIGMQSMLKWVQKNMDPKKTRVFFTSMSPSHAKSVDWGGEQGGNCYNETTIIQDPNYWGSDTRKSIMKIIAEEFSKSKIPISILNITQLSSYRKDAHTQIYKKQWSPLTQEKLADPKSYADCVHWCLPGLQDTWNELLFAKLFYP